MSGLIIAIHFIVCIFMIIVILLQAGKGADIGAAFGGGSQTVFGSRGAATFLSKVTTVSAVIFLMTSIYLAHLSKERAAGGSSVMKGATLPLPPAETQNAPAAQPETDSSSENPLKIPESKPK